MSDTTKNTLYKNYFHEIRERIQNSGLHTPSPLYGSLNIILLILGFIGGIFIFSFLHPFFVVVYFTILLIESGYISHDLIHGQYYKRSSLNRFFSYITANLMTGLSRSWWEQKHNIGHHVSTNSDIHDTDIRDYDEIFTGNPGKSPFFHKYKHYLFWCVTSVLYINLLFRSYEYILQEKKYGELVLNLLSILFVPTAFVMHFGWIYGILFLLLVYILVGIHLAFVFMVNHIGMPIIDGHKIREYAWMDLQTRTSRNILGGGVIHHVFGGLNKQIEHHLFPQIARNKIVKVAEIVRSYCQEKNIPYHEVTFMDGLREIYRTLRNGEIVEV